MVQSVTETSLPPGDYAIIEALGHRTYAGRVAEVERFGAKLLQVEPLYRDWLLDPVLLSGGALYQFTPCPPAAAWARRAQAEYDLPSSVTAALPDLMAPELTAPDWPPAFLPGRGGAFVVEDEFAFPPEATEWPGDEIAGDGA